MSTDKIIKRAVEKLREYSADDVCDRERLEPILKAYDAKDESAFFALCASGLETYRACDIFIDELCELSKNLVAS